MSDNFLRFVRHRNATQAVERSARYNQDAISDLPNYPIVNIFHTLLHPNAQTLQQLAALQVENKEFSTDSFNDKFAKQIRDYIHTSGLEHYSVSELADRIRQVVQKASGNEQLVLEHLEGDLFNTLGDHGIELISFCLQSYRQIKSLAPEKWSDYATNETANTSNNSLLVQQFGVLQDGYDTRGPAGLLSGHARVLPENTQRIRAKYYERVYIPAKKLAQNDTEACISIAELDAFAQTAFRGIKQMNRLQSKLYKAAYTTNQNLLVCAPTGAGKTNVAMLTILHEVKSQLSQAQRGMKEPLPSRWMMKIVYVAPMKALAQEVVRKFAQRLKDLHLAVAELTGDMQMTRQELEQTHVIVTTPEKWDVITRKSSTQQSLLREVKLLIIDEVHLLADQRGPVIETIVARTLRRVETTQNMIRIVGLSATLPNYVDVGQFLRVHIPSPAAGSATQDRSMYENAATNGGKGGLFFFDASYRPVPLDQTFIGINTTPQSLKSAMESTKTASEEKEGTEEKKSKDSTPAILGRHRQVQFVMNKLAFLHCLTQVRRNEQVMIFVHSRKETANTIRAIMEMAASYISEDHQDPHFACGGDGNCMDAFLPHFQDESMPFDFVERLNKSRNKELKEFAPLGFGIHHAGMLRGDRNLCEEMFEKGWIRVLCCTATLAWGVNLPAHSVLIKGTQVYNAERGGLTQLGMLDVLQIFGRAGRPQYDTQGDAVVVTTMDQLPHYLRLLSQGIPIESALVKSLSDHLNAEIVSGTVSNLREACEWLSYTYLFVRLRKNPLAYGMTLESVQNDPSLSEKRRQLLLGAAEQLEKCRMIKILKRVKGSDARSSGQIDARNIHFAITALGRVASHFYICHESIATFNELFESRIITEERTLDQQRLQEVDEFKDDEEDGLSWEKAMLILCSSKEFEQLKTREEELLELERLEAHYCRFPSAGSGGLISYVGKTVVLLQALLGRAHVTSFTLISDTNYVAQNGARVCRGLFELCLKQHNAGRALTFLQLAKSIDQRCWMDQKPLISQFASVPSDIIASIGMALANTDEYTLLTTPESAPNCVKMLSNRCRRILSSLPFLQVDYDSVLLQPISAQLLRMTIALEPLFQLWNEKLFHGKTLRYWMWVEDATSGFIYHSEAVIIHQQRFQRWQQIQAEKGSKGLEALVEFQIHLPIFLKHNEDAAYYTIRVVSDHYVGMDTFCEIAYAPTRGSQSGEPQMPFTEIMELHALPIRSALAFGGFEDAFVPRDNAFPIYLNSIQTQVFYALYHEDDDVLLCAPNGSGKTLCAEFAMLRALSMRTRKWMIYVTPLQEIALSTANRWRRVFEDEHTVKCGIWCFDSGSRSSSISEFEYAIGRPQDVHGMGIIVTTAGRLDELLRRPIMKQIFPELALVIVDDLHFITDPNVGPLYEIVLSRLARVESGRLSDPTRWIVLSSPLVNAKQAAIWLGIVNESSKVFNFAPTSRPSGIQLHIQSFPEHQHVGRMSAMNKPIYMAIKAYASQPRHQALIFVPSKAQTKQTALDLISQCISDPDASVVTPHQGFLNGTEEDLASMISSLERSSGGRRRMDDTLQHTLAFGIGLYHDGLRKEDRNLVLKLYATNMLRVMILTSEMVWRWRQDVHRFQARNSPEDACERLVILKGTEEFDPSTARYRPYSWCKMLKLVGIAKIHSDSTAVCILTEESRKNMMQRLLQEPMILESTLFSKTNVQNSTWENSMFLAVCDSRQTPEDAVQKLLGSTFFYQRLWENPAYYGIQGRDSTKESKQLCTEILMHAIRRLAASKCLRIDFVGKSLCLELSPYGLVAARHGLDHNVVLRMVSHVEKHAQGQAFGDHSVEMLPSVFVAFCDTSLVHLRKILPVRHYDLQSNPLAELGKTIRIPLEKLDQKALKEARKDPHVVKAYTLIQMHIEGSNLPGADYVKDAQLCLEYCSQWIDSWIELCAECDALRLARGGILLQQCLTQRKWVELDFDDGLSLFHVKGMTPLMAEKCRQQLGIRDLKQLSDAQRNGSLCELLKGFEHGKRLVEAVGALPVVEIAMGVIGDEVLDVKITFSNVALWRKWHGVLCSFYVFLTLRIGAGNECKERIMQFAHVYVQEDPWILQLRCKKPVDSMSNCLWKISIENEQLFRLEWTQEYTEMIR
uniref:PREDICTED: similar to activating signal cointegrator 1 complex subunit 3 putative n=1 Tax=Albugo laibachii Nc14 TaxID=890382 RepID=F0WJ83_9STRA|nr:PREDICTED: similar to activating signal cointegrator 1 complex subunit 3 putative [Albugo laibachii Nc14]|eukprot:CCA21330.1 PREDICTED: similar to activating signal cointegrator 1 complex subunit 3 putative [Albugo laibachii Nc14]